MSEPEPTPVLARQLLDPRGAHRAFLYGALAAAVLSLLVMFAGILEVTSARADVSALAERADRSTFLIGDIGRQLARMQLALLHALDEPDPEVLVRLTRAARAGERVDENLRQLEPLLTPAERRVWPSFQDRLDRAVAELEAVGRALRADDRAGAARRLDDAAALMRALQEQVDTLAHLNQSESEHLLTDARDRLSRSLWIVGLLGLLLCAGGAAIWAYAFRAERARRDLEQSMLTLARDNRELDIFAGRAAHDIRNLLAPIAVAARSLDAVSADPSRVASVAKQLRRAAERAVDVLDGLLTFARASGAAPATDRRQPASVRREVEGSLEDLRPRLARHDVAVDARVDEGRVACDPRLLRIVISNLLDNALKFAGAGDKGGHVHIAGRREEESYLLEVSDDGPGIPQDALPRLFDPFYRVEGGHAPGTGLGLATVHRIVDAHGGRVEVVSPPGEGATFRVRLPAAPASLPGAPTSEARSSAGAAGEGEVGKVS